MAEKSKDCWPYCANGSAKAPELETPTGKHAGSENFPVASWLLPARLRPHVFIFYDFARTADNIADSANLTADQKIRQLERFEDILRGDKHPPGACPAATAMRDSLTATGITIRHCMDLLAAFRQDAHKDRYPDWADLIAYCRLSAAPVGRYMIDLHGGPKSAYGPSDALCMALQILNHVQDCADDYRTLGRIYLPGDWLSEAGAGADDLAAGHCSRALRRVLDRTLTGVDDLLADARTLSGSLKSTRLALEAAVIIALAVALNSKLAKTDPLVKHVTLDPPERIFSAVRGMVTGISARFQ